MWVVLITVVLMAGSNYSSYNKGYDKGYSVKEQEVNENNNKILKERISSLFGKIDGLLKDIETTNTHLTRLKSEKAKDEDIIERVKNELDSAKDSQTGDCSVISDSRYRLYKSMFQSETQ